MKYWRCWRVFEAGPLNLFWPIWGHLIKIRGTEAYCDRCLWREALPSWTI